MHHHAPEKTTKPLFPPKLVRFRSFPCSEDVLFTADAPLRPVRQPPYRLLALWRFLPLPCRPVAETRQETQPTDPDPVPLCVDLDGTLIRADLLWEGLVRYWKQHPPHLIRSLLWWLRGRAFLKAQLARRIHVPVGRLPWIGSFLEHLRQQHRAGRSLYLVTASDRHAAQPVADHLGLFRETLASDGQTNLRSRAKARALVDRFGERGFDYPGNSRADLPVWRHARHAIVVNAPRALLRKAARLAPVAHTFDVPPRRARALLTALRPASWSRNLLVFLPILFAPQATPALLQPDLLLTLLAFCLCAAATRLWDDLMDLDADRERHDTSKRPVASGALPLSWAAAGTGVGLVAGLALAARAGDTALPACAAYSALALLVAWTAPSHGLWRMGLDTVLLMLRPLAGHAVAGVPWTCPAALAELGLCLLVAGWTFVQRGKG